MRIRLSSVLIVDSSSLSPPENRNSTRLVVSRTSRNAVPIAVEPGKPNALARVDTVAVAAATGLHVKCTP